MKIATYAKWMLRESRGSRGRMLYFIACLAVGVAAVVGTSALSASVENSYLARSREILGADFTVDARRALPPELDAVLADVDGLERSDTLETASMVTRRDPPPGVPESKLALLYAVAGRYPLYGSIVTEPAGGLDAHLRDDTVVAARALLDAMSLKPGDMLRVGGKEFRIAASVLEEPASLSFASFLGPRLYLTRAAFDQTRLLSFGSRVRYRALAALPQNHTRADLKDLVASIERRVPNATYLSFQSHFEVGPAGRQAMDRVEAFVGLVALLSLVIGGVGVAQIARAWLAGRTQAIAVMRCIGVRPMQILLLSLGHTALLALVGSIIGVVFGSLVPVVVSHYAPDLFAGDAKLVLPFGAIMRGLGLGVGLALAFCVPPLTAVWRVSPARVLRADASPLPIRRSVVLLSGLVVFGGVLAAAWLQSRSFRYAISFSGGLVALGVVLFFGARLLMKLAGAVPRTRLHPYLMHGIAALARPGAGTTGAVVALGLGTMVVTSMWLVETRVREGILAQIPERAPTVFLVDVQPDEWSSVQDVLTQHGARAVDQVPVVMARIRSIDGTTVEELARSPKGGALSRRWLTREQRLSWRDTLPEDNEIVAGQLWSHPDRREVSVEKRFSERIGVGLGSELEFDIQGVTVTFLVTSIRKVAWQSMSINFFLFIEPGALENAPALYLSNAYLDADREQSFQDTMARAHPNVTVLHVRPILEQALALLERIALGIRLLGTFTVLAGLAILAGAISATALRRSREVALLKTLGATRAGVTALFFTEYGLCGAVAGAIGAGGALLLAWVFLQQMTEISIPLPWMAFPIATLGCALLAAVCGLAASARSLRVRPIEALR